MADFVKKTWACDDTITADELNRMENGIEEALDCCGGGSAGYECTEERVTIFNGNVTTELTNPEYPEAGADAEFDAYLRTVTEEKAPTIKVTFNGTEYVCEPEEGVIPNYGAPLGDSGYDWNTYPFFISLAASEDASFPSNILTEATGTFALKIEELAIAVETSDCFQRAVDSLMPKPMRLSDNTLSTQGDVGQLSKTFGEIYEAYAVDGVPVIVSKAFETFNITMVSRNGMQGGTVVGGGHTYTASSNDSYPSYDNTSSGGGGQQ